MRGVVRSVVFVAAFGWGGVFAQEPIAKPKPAGIEGVWEGPLKVGAIELRLAFHITNGKDGKLAATLDSIDQDAKGIPCPEVAFADRKLTLGFPALMAKFVGTLAETGDKLSGKWSQGGDTFPLEMRRVEKPSTVNRPQHPKPPYPYKAEDVSFENPAAKIELAGTLTLLMGDGPFPAVVLVSGSGGQDRDESLMGHKPFLVLADHLTRHGVAVLRFDDRGVGKSKGKHDGATSADFATDAHAAVVYLKNRREIDPKRVGLVGHSEGGLIGPMVAADHPDDVAFLVLLAGPGMPGDVVLRTQQQAFLRAAGEKPEKAAVAARFQQALLSAAKAEKTTDARKKAIVAAGKTFAGSLSEAEKKLLGGEALADAAVDAAAAMLADPWMHFFLNYDPLAALRRVACPLLAVNGEVDVQVVPEANLAGIANALKEGGNERVTVKMFPGLNHLFQHSAKGLPSEYGQIEETFAPEALEYITDWVRKQK